MEFAFLGRATAAEADDDSHPPGFPHPLRPPQGDDDLAASSRRRDELMLMWELHMERIRQDSILRQLAETERAMAARFGPPGHWPLQAPPPSQDYWHHRRLPSLPPWDEAAPRPPRATTGHPPCSFGSPTAARPPPLYPHVERSPSPPSADDGGQQQERGSPGAEVSPMLGGDMDGCRSPSKWILSDGATLVPAAANAGAGTAMTPVSFAEEVTLGDRRTGCEEPKHGTEDGHGVQPFYGSGNQSSEQRETVESTIKDQSDELVARPCRYGLASQENATSDEQKRTTSRESMPHETEGLKRKLVPPQVQPSPPSCDLCQVITPSLVEHQASKRRRRLSKLKARKKPAEATTGSPPLRRNMAENSGGGGNAPRPADDGDREPVQSTRWTCQGCDAKFNSSSSLKEHLAGSLHRENTEAILAKFSSSYRLKNGGGPGLRVYYCKACKVHCTGDTMLASHLVGRRHRRKTPEARE